MKKKGFTLMELVITMTIVIILSLISWPIYRRQHLREVSLLSEGYALLGAIKDAQINYYNEYGRFLHCRHSMNREYADQGWTANDPVLGINAMNNKYFSWFNAYGVEHIAVNGLTSSFTAEVRSKSHGSIRMPFNLTTREDLSIIGDGTTTIVASH